MRREQRNQQVVLETAASRTATHRRRRAVGRALLAILFVGAGVLHFTRPAAYVGIVPGYLPHPALLVVLSGIAEMAGGIGLLIPATRRAAGWGLLLLLVAVFPANIEMLRLYREHGAPNWQQVLLWLRLPLQPLLMLGIWKAMIDDR